MAGLRDLAIDETCTISRQAGAVRCETTNETLRAGVVREIVYDHPDCSPVWFGGWSRAELRPRLGLLSLSRQSGMRRGQCLGRQCRLGSVAVEARLGVCGERFLSFEAHPRKSQYFVFFCGTAHGRVWFDDLLLERKAPPLDVRSVRFFSDRPLTENGFHAWIGLRNSADWRCDVRDSAGKTLRTFSGKGEDFYVCISTAQKLRPPSA
jgi:hypothetical protein